MVWVMIIRALIAMLLTAPFLVTHAAPLAVVAIWPLGAVAAVVWCQAQFIGRWPESMRENIVLSILKIAGLAILTLLAHPTVQYGALLYSGESWVDMFATEYNDRSLSVYIEDKVVTAQHALYWLHALV